MFNSSLYTNDSIVVRYNFKNIAKINRLILCIINRKFNTLLINIMIDNVLKRIIFIIHIILFNWSKKANISIENINFFEKYMMKVWLEIYLNVFIWVYINSNYIRIHFHTLAYILCTLVSVVYIFSLQQHNIS